MFDGPNILLKLHVDRVYTSQDIAILTFGPFGFKLPIYAFFFWGGGLWDVLPPKWIPILSQPPEGPFLGENTSDEPYIVKIHSRVPPGCVPEKKFSITN